MKRRLETELAPIRPDMTRHRCPACQKQWVCLAERRDAVCIFGPALRCSRCARGDQP